MPSYCAIESSRLRRACPPHRATCLHIAPKSNQLRRACRTSARSAGTACGTTCRWKSKSAMRSRRWIGMAQLLRSRWLNRMPGVQPMIQTTKTQWRTRSRMPSSYPTSCHVSSTEPRPRSLPAPAPSLKHRSAGHPKSPSIPCRRQSSPPAATSCQPPSRQGRRRPGQQPHSHQC